MRLRPASCWRKRGVRTREEQAETEEARERAKQEAELGVAPRLLRQAGSLVRGRLGSGDALSCQQALCRQIRGGGGGCLFAGKATQTDLLADATALFHPTP